MLEFVRKGAKKASDLAKDTTKKVSDKAKEFAGDRVEKAEKYAKRKYEDIKRGLDKDVGADTGDLLQRERDVYERKGRLRKKSMVHKGLDAIERNPKKTVASASGVAGYAMGDDDEDDIDIGDLIEKRRDGKRLTAAEDRLLRLMSE